MDNRLPKHERLSGRKRIDDLFAAGHSGFVFPFKYIYSISHPVTDNTGVSVLVSVPKKMHKRAVGRNKIKRRAKEAFRLGKAGLSAKAAADGVQIDIALIYISKETEEYQKIENAVARILAQIAENI